MTLALAPTTEIIEAPPVVLDFPEFRLPELQNKIDIANRRLDRAGITERFSVTIERYQAKKLKGGIELEDGTTFGATEVTEPYIRATLNEINIGTGYYTFVAALVGEEAGYTVHCAPGQNLDGWQVHLSDPTDEEAPTPGLPEVVGSGANTEVAGLNTNGSIAGMKDKETVGDFSNEDSVGDSVGSITTINTGSNLSVSGAIGSASPVPTDITVGGITHGEKEGLLQGEATRGSLGDFSTAVPVESGVVPKTESPGFHLGVAPAHRAHHANRVPVCDHCNLKRDRRRLYIIRDNRDGSLAQIGHSCIELYTGLKLKGLWALEFGKELRGFGSEDSGGPRDYSAPVDRVLGLSFAFADEGRGYVSMKAAEFGDRNPTAQEVRTALFGRVEQPRRSDYRNPADYQRALEDYQRFLDNIQKGIAFSEDAALIAEIRAAADTLTPGSDYAENMRVILAGEYVSYRNVGILASLVAIYAREKELRVQREKAPAPAKGFLAPVKTRVRNISLTLTTVKTWEGQYGWTTLLVGRTPEGNIVKWFASGLHDYEAGDTLNLKAATVKAHEEYQGQDQTVVTRGIIA